MLKYLIRYKLSLLLAGIIFVLSLMPGGSLPESRLFSIPFLDKIVHMGMYASLGFLVLLETRCSSCTWVHAGLLGLVFLMGLSIEVLQAVLIESRSAEWLDLLANLAGIFLAYLAFRVLRSLSFRSPT